MRSRKALKYAIKVTIKIVIINAVNKYTIKCIHIGIYRKYKDNIK